MTYQHVPLWGCGLAVSWFDPLVPEVEGGGGVPEGLSQVMVTGLFQRGGFSIFALCLTPLPPCFCVHPLLLISNPE